MKKAIVFLLFILLTLSAYAEEEKSKDGLFEALQLNHMIMSFADYTTTTFTLVRYEAIELNPIARFYVKKPILSLTIITASNLIIHSLSNSLYKKNKILAYITIVVITIAKGYVLYHNLREIRS